MESEIVITTGRGHLKVTLPAEVLDSYDDDGNAQMRDTSAVDAVAVYGQLITLLEAAGHLHEKPAPAPSPGAPAPGGGPLPPGMSVPMHCGRPCEFKDAYVNPKTKKHVPAKYQCTNDDCPDIATNRYKWSIFVDKYIQQQGG